MGTRLFVLLASGVLAVGAVPALAAGGGGVRVSWGGNGSGSGSESWGGDHGYGGHGHHASCATQRSHAGVLFIDGRRTTIPSGSGAAEAIAHAFRCAGYQASCQGGRVVVRWSCTRPNVRWFGEASNASLSWSRDCLTVTTRTVSCGCTGHHSPSVRVTLPIRHDWCPPQRPSRPGWGRHPSRNRCD